MNLRRGLLVAALTAATAVLGWLLFIGLPRWYGKPVTVRSGQSSAPAPNGRKIKAHLFYISEDGSQLAAVDRDVAYGEGTAEQAKQIITAQLDSAAPPLVSAIPAGTKLRALFVTERGEAYVDFTREIVSAHPGGSLAELLTVYTVVDALAANLPAVKAVQLLVDGKEVETLAGHVDLRHPLVSNTDWVVK